MDEQSLPSTPFELRQTTQVSPLVMELMRERDRLAIENQALKEELDKRPRTEFVAVGWWTGSSLEWEPSLTPVRGMLLFRPVPDKRSDAARMPSSTGGKDA